jgi:S1-C subfamily serine protease
MKIARIAPFVALIAAVALIGVPKVGRLLDRLDSQQRNVVSLRLQLSQLRNQHVDLESLQQGLAAEQLDLLQQQHGLILDQENLAQHLQGLDSGQKDLASSQSKLATEQIGLASTQKEITSAQHAMLNGQTQLSVQQQRLSATQLSSLLDQKELIAGLESQAELLSQELEKAYELHESLNHLVASSAGHKVEMRHLDLQQKILHPVFQLSGGEAVGSAVLVSKGKDDLGSYYLALSCFHVVRDILEERGEIENLRQEKLSAIFTDIDASERKTWARLLEWDVDNDLALLRLDTDQDLGSVAKFASKNSQQHLGVFSEIYTVGCPLGTAAQATRGEITRQAWEIGGQDYWMISSPAYFGNSGGGVFGGESLELIGIFAKIYTHGSYRPQVITHMGLAIPIHVIHDWIESVGYGEILPPAPAVAVSEASLPD